MLVLLGRGRWTVKALSSENIGMLKQRPQGMKVCGCDCSTWEAETGIRSVRSSLTRYGVGAYLGYGKPGFTQAKRQNKINRMH